MPPVLKRLLLWTFICCGSAAPSFLIGHALYDRVDHTIAMLLGIAVFIAAYTWVTGTRRFRSMRRNRYMRRALFSGFTTRIAITIIYPVGMFLDMVCGILSVESVKLLPIPDKHSVSVFLTTLVQGAVLNFVLGLLILAIYGLQRLFSGKLPEIGAECERCHYDLRATTGICPECGTPVPMADAPATSRAA